jgi:hypothetical protein
MTINHAQLVFKSDFHKMRIFSFLNISSDTRVGLIKEQKCEKQVRLQQDIVSRIQYHTQMITVRVKAPFSTELMLYAIKTDKKLMEKAKKLIEKQWIAEMISKHGKGFKEFYLKNK